MLELERCEETIYKIFDRRREETWFDYNNIDQVKLYKYKIFLSNVTKTYNAMISKEISRDCSKYFYREKEGRGPGKSNRFEYKEYQSYGR